LRPNLALGAVLGLAFGLMLALYREGTDSRVRERGDVEREFALPVLATIPRLSGAVSILPVPALRRPNDEARLLTGRSESPHRSSKNRLIARQAFRTLATDLWFATRGRNGGGTVVAVTSAVQGEGKTFVACNLALARASQGARTILIDGDVRGGGATKFFGLTSSVPGLSDILEGNPALYGEGADGVWEKRVWVGLMNHAQLWVIPPGTASLYSARFHEFAALLEQFKSRFDLIVIDAPPMNLAADTVPIAAISDAVLVVARGSLTTRDSLKLTLERLGRTRSYVIGAVLNDVKPTRDADEAYEYAGTEEVLT
jgi:capsular exopolysaccharide synthesis family protein